MNIKICATTNEKFCKIEESIKKINNQDFVNNFSNAEYVLEGFNTIQLISRDIPNKNKIDLPREFIIKEINFEENFTYLKIGDEIKELIRYKIEINANYIDGDYIQEYKLIYPNLCKIIATISTI